MGTLSHNTAWEGSTTQNSQEQTYTFSTGGKYSDKDIKFKVSAKSGSIGTIGMSGTQNSDGTYTVTASQTNTAGWTSGNKSNSYKISAASVGDITLTRDYYVPEGSSYPSAYRVSAYQSNSSGYFRATDKSATIDLPLTSFSDVSSDTYIGNRYVSIIGHAAKEGWYNPYLSGSCSGTVYPSDMSSALQNRYRNLTNNAPADFTRGTAVFDGHRRIFCIAKNGTTVYAFNIKDYTWTTLGGATAHEYSNYCLVGDWIHRFGYSGTYSSSNAKVNAVCTTFPTSATPSSAIPNGAQTANISKDVIYGKIWFMCSKNSTYRKYMWTYSVLDKTWTTRNTNVNELYYCSGSGENRNGIFYWTEGSYGPQVYCVSDGGKIWCFPIDYDNAVESQASQYVSAGGVSYGPVVMIEDDGNQYLYLTMVASYGQGVIYNCQDNTITTKSGFGDSTHYPYCSAGCVANGDIYFFGSAYTSKDQSKRVSRITVQNYLKKLD